MIQVFWHGYALHFVTKMYSPNQATIVAFVTNVDKDQTAENL